MKIVNEFKAFAMRGNVVDMAVGIIIGGAFGKIISSVVADVIMPPIGLLMGGVSFTDLKLILKDPVLDAAGKITTQAVSINYGNFIQVTVDFLIIAFAIFMMIKAMNTLKRKGEIPAEEPAPEPPTNQEVLLAEIRDLLKNK
jgi:large conductance mechanosensitive channel